MIQFFIDGEPIPTPRPRVTMRGKFAHAYTPKSHAIWGWRTLINLHSARTRPRRPFRGPLWISLTFYMPRPQAHFLRGELCPDAPHFHTNTCDFDNLAKGVCDELTHDPKAGRAGYWVDDSQLCEARVSKLYANSGKVGCFVQIARPNKPAPMLALMEVG